jgi:energy-coupling factor transport system permease protein
MRSLAEEVLAVQSKRTLLHVHKALYLKVALVIAALASRFLHFYVMVVVLAVALALMLYVGAWRVLVTTLALWSTLASLIVLLDLAFSTLTLSVFFNLVYGFTTFATLALLYLTTPPRQVRDVLGFNALSLAYLFLSHSIKLVGELIDVMRARGWSPSLSPRAYAYPLRALAFLLVSRSTEVTEALKARGVED